jgi:hypothetical protein
MDVDADADALAAAASDADDAAAQSDALTAEAAAAQAPGADAAQAQDAVAAQADADDAFAAAADGAPASGSSSSFDDEAAPGGGVPRLLPPERRAIQRHMAAFGTRFPVDRAKATKLVHVHVAVPKQGLPILHASRGGVDDEELGRLSAGFAMLAANLLGSIAEEDRKTVAACCTVDPKLRLHAKNGPSPLQLLNIVFADRKASARLLNLMSRIARPMEALRSAGGAGGAGDVDDGVPGGLSRGGGTGGARGTSLGGGGAGTGAPYAAPRARRGAAAEVLMDPEVARLQPLALLPVPAGALRSAAAPVANSTGRLCCVSAASHALCNPAMLRFLGAHAPVCAADTAGRAAGGRPCYACAFDNFFEHSRRTVGALADSPLLRHVLASKGLSERKQHDAAEILLYLLNQFVNDSDLWQRQQWNPRSNDAALPRPPCVGFITTSRVCACRARHGIVIERELMIKVAAPKPSGRRAPPLELEELLRGYFQPRIVDEPGNRINCTAAGCSRRFAEQESFFLLPEVLYVELKRGAHGAGGQMARHTHRIDVGDSINLTQLVPLDEEELERLGDGGRFDYDVASVIFKEGGVLGGHYVSATRELDAAALGGGAAPAAAAAPPAAPAFNFFDDGNLPVRTTLSATMDENSQNTYVVALVARDPALHERVLGLRRQMNDAQRREHALNVTSGMGFDAESVGSGGDGDGASDGASDGGGGGGGPGSGDASDVGGGGDGGGSGGRGGDDDVDASDGAGGEASSDSPAPSKAPPARALKRRAQSAPPTPPRPAPRAEEDDEAGFVRRRRPKPHAKRSRGPRGSN